MSVPLYQIPAMERVFIEQASIRNGLRTQLLLSCPAAEDLRHVQTLLSPIRSIRLCRSSVIPVQA